MRTSLMSNNLFLITVLPVVDSVYHLVLARLADYKWVDKILFVILPCIWNNLKITLDSFPTNKERLASLASDRIIQMSINIHFHFMI